MREAMTVTLSATDQPPSFLILFTVAIRNYPRPVDRLKDQPCEDAKCSDSS
jgi:hypothetical protein